MLFYLCQIRSHVRFLVIIGYYTLLYSYNLNPIKNTHLRHVTGSRIFSVLDVQYVLFFRVVHYVREVTRWFLSSASKLFLIVIYNQINLFDI